MHYVVERRECGEQHWEQIGEPTDTKLRVYGLRNGVQYEFRVSARNVAGLGMPLHGNRVNTPPLCLPAPCAPRADTANLRAKRMLKEKAKRVMKEKAKKRKPRHRAKKRG